MARDPDDIVTSMQESTAVIDPTIDVSKGPVLETSFIPWANELSETETGVETLSRLFQLDSADLWSEDDLRRQGRQFGIQLESGQFSQGFLTFYTLERPTQDIPIPLGTIAGTQDSTYLFQTIEEATMFEAAADAYFNAETRRYEITVAAQATVSGTEYDVKQGRIVVLLSNLTDITGVTNNSDFFGGDAEQSLDDFVDEIRQLPLGNSLGSPGGLAGVFIKSAVGIISDVAILTPADIGIFERLSESGLRAAIDIYVLGTRIGIATQSYTTVGAETEIAIEQSPVLTVSSVLVDGTAVAYSFVQDENPAVRGSTAANDKVVLDTAPGAGKDVYISYTYNKLVSDLQSVADDMPIFETSTRVREGKPVRIVVDVTIGSLSIGTTASDIEDAITDFFKNTEQEGTTQKFIGEATPEVLSNELKTRLEEDIGISVTRFNQFNRPDRATADVQSIPFGPHEYASPIEVTVRL